MYGEFDKGLPMTESLCSLILSILAVLKSLLSKVCQHTIDENALFLQFAGLLVDSQNRPAGFL